MSSRWLLVLLAAASCTGDAAPDEDDEDFLDGKSDGASPVDIAATRLDVDLAGLHAVAELDLEKPGNVILEVGGLTIFDVSDDRGHRRYSVLGGKLRVSSVRGPLLVSYGFERHDMANGLLPGGSTVVWPYFCGNLFPCHSQPRDGMTMSLNVTGVPAGKVAVWTPSLTEAPAYQLAWAIDYYTELSLGATTAGTEVSVWYRPTEFATAQNGTQNLVAVFDWYEKTLGPYRFGSKVGTVSVNWGADAYGGMEHHPRWHISASSLGSQEANAHEAAHGWFGDGVRIACWEDFVLSEGTVSYLTARALDMVAPAIGAQTWARYTRALAEIPSARLVWPQTCNKVDILKDNLYTTAPYLRGAFFYKAVAGKVGADKVDQVLAAFYREFAGKSAHMSDMLTTIKTVTGYDPTACAQRWLKDTTTPTVEACP